MGLASLVILDLQAVASALDYQITCYADDVPFAIQIWWKYHFEPFSHLPWECYPFCTYHDDIIKWKHFPCYWPFVWGIHWSPVNSPHKGQWRRALMFSLIYTWTNGWVNNQDAGDLRCHHAHYDLTVMPQYKAIVMWVTYPNFAMITSLQFGSEDNHISIRLVSEELKLSDWPNAYRWVSARKT